VFEDIWGVGQDVNAITGRQSDTYAAEIENSVEKSEEDSVTENRHNSMDK
jgi:hypothetical protein